MSIDIATIKSNIAAQKFDARLVEMVVNDAVRQLNEISPTSMGSVSVEQTEPQLRLRLPLLNGDVTGDYDTLDEIKASPATQEEIHKRLNALPGVEIKRLNFGSCQITLVIQEIA